ncbi:unnamed protein product [Hydatigera taeniaeformis]|uniref:Uncharacterized protein n=1 Tax=Hydatigena taeniaeformis TaxID=6205 RepID=A0A3P7FIH6_HYDTA|nr:unnamed protein product [Hydatigera taeniaeformis]
MLSGGWRELPVALRLINTSLFLYFLSLILSTYNFSGSTRTFCRKVLRLYVSLQPITTVTPQAVALLRQAPTVQQKRMQLSWQGPSLITVQRWHRNSHFLEEMYSQCLRETLLDLRVGGFVASQAELESRLETD